jgi:hypothetical protein
VCPSSIAAVGHSFQGAVTAPIVTPVHLHRVTARWTREPDTQLRWREADTGERGDELSRLLIGRACLNEQLSYVFDALGTRTKDHRTGA